MNTTLLTIPEVANILRVDDATVRRWIRKGTLEAVTLPSKSERLSYRIKKSTLDKVLNNVVTPTRARTRRR